MKTILRVLTLALIPSTAFASPPQAPQPEVHHYTIDQFLATTVYSGSSINNRGSNRYGKTFYPKGV